MNGYLSKAVHQTRIVAKLLRYNALDMTKLENTTKYIIPAENAHAILENCSNINFFPNGAKAPESRAQAIEVADSMAQSLAALQKEVAAHGERRALGGSALLGQYTLKMKKIPEKGAKLLKRIASQLAMIDILMKTAVDEASKEDFYKIKVIAQKLAKEVETAIKLIQRNFVVLTTALIQCKKDR